METWFESLLTLKKQSQLGYLHIGSFVYTYLFHCTNLALC